MSILNALKWLAEKGGKKGKHFGFDELVAKLMAKGYTKEQATKIAGKVYWEQKRKEKKKARKQ